MTGLITAADSLVVDNIEAGIIVLDADGTILRFNPWVAAASGMAVENALGRTLADVFPALANPRLTFAIGAAFNSGASTLLSHVINGVIFPLTTRGHDGLVHDVMVSSLDSPTESRCLIHIVDVTASARKEQFLRERQNARYNAVVGSAPDVILTLDEDSKILFANPAALTQFGYAGEELIGRNAAELFRSPEAWSSIWREIMTGDVLRQSRDLVAIRKDGSSSHLEMLGSRWQTDSRVFATAILRDVNEKREIHDALANLNATLEEKVTERTASLMQAEEALRQGQKMEAVGQLTSGIAHDFNNLLQGIGGSLQLARKRIESGRVAEVAKFMADALQCTERASTLTHRLLAFSRKQPVDPRPTDASALIASIEEFLRRSIGKHVKLDVALEPHLWLARCDVNQLENALLNAAINARDAMPNGGKITVDTANRVLDTPQALERGLTAGEYVCIAVIDTGSGMSAETKSKAFDPFFTTKAVGTGTGLGLSMIYGFVRQSGGAARLESEEGVGTKIEIYLPRFVGDMEAEPPEEIAEKIVPSGGDEVVLVVEDEGIIRMLIVEVLSDLGYRALEAEDGLTALRILNSPQRVDLLVTDIGLADINGWELAETARLARPALSVLFITGNADHGATRATGHEELIQKPFSMDAIASRIRGILVGRRH